MRTALDKLGKRYRSRGGGSVSAGPSGEFHNRTNLSSSTFLHTLHNIIFHHFIVVCGPVIYNQFYKAFFIFLIGIVGGVVQVGPPGTAATNRFIAPAPGDYDDGEIGGMIGRGNRNTRIKPAPLPLCPPQTPHAARTRTQPAAVGSQRLTNRLSYDTAYLKHSLQEKHKVNAWWKNQSCDSTKLTVIWIKLTMLAQALSRIWVVPDSNIGQHNDYPE
jgi:hypothetical protein